MLPMQASIRIAYQEPAGQSQKKRKLSGQQDICRLNFPDKARKSRKFSNSRQMSEKGVHARS